MPRHEMNDGGRYCHSWRHCIDTLKMTSIGMFLPLVMGLIVVTVVLSSTPSSSTPTIGTVSTLPCGLVEGHHGDNIWQFQGIPYAQPPVGRQGRWHPPRSQVAGTNTCWNGTLMARKFGNSCAQGEGDHIGHEDCLFLNVYTPTLSGITRLS
jgi:para-nitrobenzyl esterase